MPYIPSTSQPYTQTLHSRRFLLHNPLYKPPSQQNQVPPDRYTPDSGTQPGNSFDANVVMILAVLLCALICALGLNSIVRCALRCSSRVSGSNPEPSLVIRLAQTRLRRKALQAMPILIYSSKMKFNATNPVCAICLSDFETGERVRVLPKCNHGFHVRCIDRWLMARSSCPTCRRCLFSSQHKTSDCSGLNQTEDPVRLVLVPLEPEGLATRHGS